MRQSTRGLVLAGGAGMLTAHSALASLLAVDFNGNNSGPVQSGYSSQSLSNSSNKDAYITFATETGETVADIGGSYLNGVANQSNIGSGFALLNGLVISAVPEPASSGLLAVGSLGLLGRRDRR